MKSCLRMDDVGASTKWFNQHGKVKWKLGAREYPIAFFANWGFFKRVEPFRRWAVYNELDTSQWELLLSLLHKYGAKLTVGITANWVERNGDCVPFDKKFPSEASIIREGEKDGLLEIANHGFCHCVLENQAFLPRAFSSNRTFHREFWDWIPPDIQEEHIACSQEILHRIFTNDIVTFVPPGNVWTPTTERIAAKYGLKYLSSLEERSPTGKKSNDLIYVGGKVVLDFHDREIVRLGASWLEGLLQGLRETIFIKELGENLDKNG
jgi:hypothetical protein